MALPQVPAVNYLELASCLHPLNHTTKAHYKNMGRFFKTPTMKQCYKIALCFYNNFYRTILIGPFEILVWILLVLQNPTIKSYCNILL